MQTTVKIDSPLEKDIKSLIHICESFDGFSPAIQFATDLNFYKEMPCFLTEYRDDLLVGVAVIFAPNTVEVELSMAVLPSYRRQGIGTSFVRAIRDIIAPFNYKRILLACEDGSDMGKAFAASLGATLSHTEYSLEYAGDLPPRATRLLVSRAYEKDIPAMAAISVDAFEDDYEIALQYYESSFANPTRTPYIGQLNYEPVCTLMLGNEDGVYSLNGIAVLKTHQNKGFGRELINEVLYGLINSGTKILIDVDSHNDRAYHLYKSIGFKEIHTVHYFEIPL
jgi:ribosomal protein S18 acetylase RimI-like enzyme